MTLSKTHFLRAWDCYIHLSCLEYYKLWPGLKKVGFLFYGGFMFDLTDGQKLAIIKLSQKAMRSNNRNIRSYFLSQLLDRNIGSVNELQSSDWQFIRNLAYQNWQNDDWEISQPFMEKAGKIKRQYEEEVLGQRNLF